MHYINYCEFYITNVCNLACNGCNRFNNFKFKGFQKWNDYKDLYEQWSKEIKFGSVAILGGEPLLNPDCLEWIKGINLLWPRTGIRIISNGYYLPKLPDLYSILEKNKNIQLWVGIHNKKHKKQIIDIVENFLQKPIKYTFDNTNIYQQFMVMVDKNNVKVRVEYNWWFHQGTLLRNENGFTLHQSDPVKAHNNCSMKECHHMIEGKLYKCGVVGVLPEFYKQHKIILNQDDLDLMLNYKPLTIDADVATKNSFIKNLKNSVPQCKFCPEVYKGDMIFAEEKSSDKK